MRLVFRLSFNRLLRCKSKIDSRLVSARGNANPIASGVALACLVRELFVAECSFVTVEAGAGAVEAESIAVAVVVASCDVTRSSIESFETRAQRNSKRSGLGESKASALACSATLTSKLILGTHRDLTCLSSPTVIAVAQAGLAESVTVTTRRVTDVLV